MPSQSLALAYDYCRNVTRAHYENFPVGSVLIPRALRPHVYAIYAFSRIADDFSDEPEFAENRLAYLEDWEKQLSEMAAHTPTHPVFLALCHTVKTQRLTPSLLSDLLQAFKLDLTKTHYENDDELLMYCRYSANPVGRLILELFDYRDAQLFAYSDAICTALQLANHWQDLSIDCPKRRFYIPKHRLQIHGVEESDLLTQKETPAFKQLLRELVSWTEELFVSGMPLCSALRSRLRLEIRATILGGMQILNKIKNMDYAVLGERPRLKKRDWFRLIGALCK